MRCVNKPAHDSTALHAFDETVKVVLAERHLKALSLTARYASAEEIHATALVNDQPLHNVCAETIKSS